MVYGLSWFLKEQYFLGPFLYVQEKKYFFKYNFMGIII